MPMSPQVSATVQGLFAGQGVTISAVGKALQRKAKAAVQLRPGNEAFPVDLRPMSGGWPLPRDVQGKMEAALGANFSDVRIHVGPEAASIGAIAFTWGTDIHFSPGQYNPHTPHGQFLLGHELTHVVQQRAGRVANPYGTGVAVVQDQALEAEADRMGRMAAISRPPVRESAGGAGARTVFGTPAGRGARSSGVVNRKPAQPAVYAVRPAMASGAGWRIQMAASGRAEPVGSVQLTPKDNGVYISNLRVEPGHRHHGLARQLLQAAMRTARSHGFPVAKLEARPDSAAETNPAALVSMYQRFGFRTTGLSHRGNPVMERTT
jgi:ribosomal protein S18 acetylase RimI-like enzyme